MNNLPVSLVYARQFANLLDTAFTIPIINKRVGLDPFLSLVPYAGSIVSGLLSLYLLYVAWSLKLPSIVMIKMIANIVVDVAIGGIPLVGSLLDAAWRSNSKNVQLLEKAYRLHQTTVVIS
jgi:Domain of unknown function (DUF4112)